VGNRAAWLGGGLGGGELNHVSPATYAQFGLYPYPGTGPAGYNYAPAGISCQAGNDCDRALLGQQLSTTAVIQKLAAAGIKNYLPYSGFSTSNTLSSIVGRPFPQFGNIGPSGSPTGNSKYDSLQIKATKRLSHNLQASGFFTWAQGFTRATRQDFFNAASSVNSIMQIPPRTLNFSFIYTTPKSQYLEKVKFLNTLIKDWQLSGFANYQSGAFLGIPTNTNTEFLTTQEVQVKGQPLYLKDINSQINPYTDVILNAAAWAPCPVNTNCGNSGSYLKGYRARRHPSENANIGRNFRIRERMNLQIRGEFVNIFNRTLYPPPSAFASNPSITGPQNAITRNTLGIITGGFGTMNSYQGPGTANIFTGVNGPRSGTVIARFTF
jgi:hypothetical protein